MIILNAETRSLKRASIVMQRVVGLSVSANTIERIALEVGNALEAAEPAQWKRVLTGEATVPSLAVVEFDGGRIRTRKTDCGLGVHLDGKGWNETKNAIFVSATSETRRIAKPACRRRVRGWNPGEGNERPNQGNGDVLEQPCRRRGDSSDPFGLAKRR